MDCCERSVRVRAPVDRILPGQRVRLRHISGEVCLNCHLVTAPDVRPSYSLKKAITNYLEGHYARARIVVLKTCPNSKGKFSICERCGAFSEPVFLDLGFGPHAEFVLQSIDGRWCWNCLSAVVADRKTLRHLIASPSFSGGAINPSLLYDTADHPGSVQFEVTTRCNLRCAYCSNPELDAKKDVSLGSFIQALQRIDLEKVDNVDFTGLGESVLHPQLPEMVGEVLRRGRPSHIRIVTNGTILTTKRFLPLCEAGVTSIAFSIDSLNPDRFARSRGGARLDVVLKNLGDLVEHRRNQNLPLAIKIKSVLIEDPYEEAGRILAYSARMGLEMPHFSCLDTRHKATAFYRESWLKQQWTSKDDGSFLEWVDTEWRRLGGQPPRSETELGTVADRRSGFHHPLLLPQNVCRWAVDAAFVSSQGTCISCCEQMLDIPRLSWGTLFGSSLGKIWRDQMFWGYRLPLTLRCIPSGCVGCSHAPDHGIPMAQFEHLRNDQTTQSTSAMPTAGIQ
jgi:MoaA/NifB/PqqE/SkfB family radical SAM enzyme